MFSVLALVTPLAFGVVIASPLTIVSEASAEPLLPNLCDGTTNVCEPCANEDAPVLRADVCWDGKTVTLEGEAGCPSYTRAYHLSFGYVIEPITNTVLPLKPLLDTCDLGYCMPNQLDAGTIITDGVACCDPKSGQCENPDKNGVCTVGDVTWCKTLEDNGDGTVTCHE